MSLKRAFPAQSLLNGTFAISLFLLLLLSAASYRNTVTVARASDSLVHSYEVRIELVQLLSYMKDAETGQRGFIITKDSLFLQPYRGARDKVMRSFETLKALTADNPAQQANLDSLQKLIDLRFSMLEVVRLESTSGNPDRLPLFLNMIRGKNAMDANRYHIDQMLALEFERFEAREKAYHATRKETYNLNLLFLLFSLAVFVAFYVNIKRNLAVLQRANRRLTIANESIRHAEEIGHFGTWHLDLATNRHHYSDNQYRLLGCEPQSFEPTVERFTEFVHPDDRHVLKAGLEQLYGESRTATSFFRIVRRDGEVRHFMAIGILLSDRHGHQTLIGVNMDITEQHLVRLELEAKNRALEASNRELESFNRMASHDLQEPLRKIQAFISRIEEVEGPELSEKGRNYFERITAAATRMRALINDLLLFANTSRPEKSFEATDLNTKLENAKLELAQAIEEKKAIVTSAHLPELRVIPFQIRQLFINLIANSIKYSRPGIAPRIEISCGPALAEDYPGLPFETGKKYVRISFADNGIGFEQQYAGKIFDLFYRLRGTAEKTGSGLGLAICKKIAENHGGFITAEGVPGEGATFTVFLPENAAS